MNEGLSNTEQLRFDCLALAVQLDAADSIRTAAAFYDYVRCGTVKQNEPLPYIDPFFARVG